MTTTEAPTGGALDRAALRQIGRLRLGRKVPYGTQGKTRPERLDTWRLTSPDHGLIDLAAALYGGEAQPWEGAPGQQPQWEVITTSDRLPVALPPTRAFSRKYELWGKPPGQDRAPVACLRRCDGTNEEQAPGPCLCEADNRDCTEIVRLNVVLHELPRWGVFRLDTHGFYACGELAGVMELVAPLRAWVPAMLGMETRRATRIRKDNGKAELLEYVVPTLDLEATPGQLVSLLAPPAAAARAVEPGSGARGALPAPASAAAPVPPAPPPTAAPAGRPVRELPHAFDGQPGKACKVCGQPDDHALHAEHEDHPGEQLGAGPHAFDAALDGWDACRWCEQPADDPIHRPTEGGDA